jgi:hypothetical protein
VQSDPHEVFISYSWDNEDHIRNVLALAQWLRSSGVDAWVDRFDSPTEPWPLWCYRQVEAADAVLVVCSELYRRRVMREQGDGTGRGATWEGAIISNEVYSSVSGQDKFIPIVFFSGNLQYVPFFLEGYSVYDLSDEDGRTDLYARLTGQQRFIPEPLGPRRKIARTFLETALPVGQDVRSTSTPAGVGVANPGIDFFRSFEGKGVAVTPRIPLELEREFRHNAKLPESEALLALCRTPTWVYGYIGFTERGLYQCERVAGLVNSTDRIPYSDLPAWQITRASRSSVKLRKGLRSVALSGTSSNFGTMLQALVLHVQRAVQPP